MKRPKEAWLKRIKTGQRESEGARDRGKEVQERQGQPDKRIRLRLGHVSVGCKVGCLFGVLLEGGSWEGACVLLLGPGFIQTKLINRFVSFSSLGAAIVLSSCLTFALFSIKQHKERQGKRRQPVLGDGAKQTEKNAKYCIPTCTCWW